MISADRDSGCVSRSHYAGYILFISTCLIFREAAHFLNLFSSRPSVQNTFSWGFMLLLLPFVYATVFAGIGEPRRTGGGLGRLLLNGFKYFWRFFLITLFSFIFCHFIQLLLGKFGISTTTKISPSISFDLLFALFFILRFLWFSSVVGERGHLFLSLSRMINLLVRNRTVLRFAILIGLFSVGQNIARNFFPYDMRNQSGLLMEGLCDVVFACLMVWMASRVIPAYRRARIEVFGESAEKIAIQEAAAETSKGLPAGVMGSLLLLSFLPPFNLAAFIVGWIQIKRNQRFSITTLSTCFLGGFFTLLSLLILVGSLLPRSGDSVHGSYQFLADVDPSLQPQIDLLEAGEFDRARTELDQLANKGAKQSWALKCALGVAVKDNEEALTCFQQCAEAKPDRGEFYYLYGKSLLYDEKTTEAAAKFQQARQYGFQNDDVNRLLLLAQNAYEPSRINKFIWSAIVLIFLFTTHEFGHAYAAWRMGDDTAKNQGRLTLNPLAHLDLFGSIILPGILLWRNAGFLIGWAKPVPFDRSKFANPRHDECVVAFTGPAINLVVVLGSFLLLLVIAVALRAFYPESVSMNLAWPYKMVSLAGIPYAETWAAVFTFIKELMYTSLMLGFFNLLPIPPLDGSWVLSSLLPERVSVFFEKLRPFSLIFIIIIFTTSFLDNVLVVPMIGTWGILSFSFATIGFH